MCRRPSPEVRPGSVERIGLGLSDRPLGARHVLPQILDLFLELAALLGESLGRENGALATQFLLIFAQRRLLAGDLGLIPGPDLPDLADQVLAGGGIAQQQLGVDDRHHGRRQGLRRGPCAEPFEHRPSQRGEDECRAYSREHLPRTWCQS